MVNPMKIPEIRMKHLEIVRSKKYRELKRKQTLNQWKNLNIRKKMIEHIKIGTKIGMDNFKKTNSEKYKNWLCHTKNLNKGKNNSMYGKTHKKESKTKMSLAKKGNPQPLQSKLKKELYKIHPEKHPNHILSKNRNRMKKSTEKVMFRILSDSGFAYKKDFFFNYNVYPYWLDFAIPEIKLAIETDGKRWHADKKKDLLRTKYLNKLGWNVIRFTDEELKKPTEVRQEVNKIIRG
jgi:very-short-patch-repair endonuclease